MKSILITILLISITPIAYALEISSPPPIKLLLLPYPKVYEGKPTKGEHGLNNYCYKVDEIYVIYSINLLGEGYSFIKDKPNQQCNSSKSNINYKNNLGISVGTSIAKASKLLGVKLSEGKNTVTWHYQRSIRNLPFDDMTILNITIKNGKINAINLFNTVTN